MTGETALGRSLVLGALLVSAAGCDVNTAVQTGAPDTAKPAIQVLSPRDTVYDVDGDKLIDLSLVWHDAHGVDLHTVRVRSLTGVRSPADTAANLLHVWGVVRLDSTGMLLRENVAGLLPGGLNRLEVRVSDERGNSRSDTIAFALPYAAFFGTIDAGQRGQVHDVALNRAGTRGYATAGKYVVVFDAESLRVLATVLSPHTFDYLKRIVLDESRDMAFVSDGRIERFSLTTNAFFDPIPNTYITWGMAASRVRPGLLYTADAQVGWLGFVDVESNMTADFLQIPGGCDYEPVHDIAVLSGDRKLYMSRGCSGGVLVIDPHTRTILGNPGKFGGPGGPDPYYWSNDLDLSADERRLYVATSGSASHGLVVLDTQGDTDVGDVIVDGDGQALKVSPSQRRLFLTTSQTYGGPPTQNWLFALPSWRILARFDRPASPGTTRYDLAVAFRPDGKLIFVGRDLVIDVYLNREMQN